MSVLVHMICHVSPVIVISIYMQGRYYVGMIFGNVVHIEYLNSNLQINNVYFSLGLADVRPCPLILVEAPL